MPWCVFSTFSCLLALSSWTFVQHFMSFIVPRSLIWSFWIWHLGQGQHPRDLIFARSTLWNESTDVIFIWRNSILFWVISAIDKKAWIELTKNSICAFHYNAMLVCFHKLIIKQKLPYCMDELLFKMCSQRGGDILSKNSIKGLFNIVGRLWECSIEEWLTKKITYRLHVDEVVCGKWRWFWTLILCLISP